MCVAVWAAVRDGAAVGVRVGVRLGVWVGIELGVEVGDGVGTAPETSNAKASASPLHFFRSPHPVWYAPVVVGKKGVTPSVEVVVPVTYALPLLSTAIAPPESVFRPPNRVEKSNLEPAELSTVRITFWVPLRAF